MTQDVTVPTLVPGRIVWADGDPVRGREQGGRRPFVVVSSSDHLELADTLMLVAPVTSARRNWANHVRVMGDTGLQRDSWVMTEQVRVMSRERIFGYLGNISPQCLGRVRLWVGEFLGVVT
jgi:mRNA interferase MazF